MMHFSLRVGDVPPSLKWIMLAQVLELRKPYAFSSGLVSFIAAGRDRHSPAIRVGDTGSVKLVMVEDIAAPE
jgi:hypothetical protein